MIVWTLCFGLLATGFACALVRAVLGPTVADRAVAADIGLYVIISALALLAAMTGAGQFIDVALIAVLLGFLATVALAALVGRQRS